MSDSWGSPIPVTPDLVNPIKAYCNPADKDWLMRMLPPICRGPEFQWRTSSLCPASTIWIDEGPHQKVYKLSLSATEVSGE